MARHLLITVPALMLLVACNSPNDGTTRSETETVPSEDGTVTAPTDVSEPATAPTTDGTATTTGTPGAAATGMPPPVNDETGIGTPPVNDGTGTTDKKGTPPPAK